MRTEQAVNAVTQSLTTESILSRVMPKGNGKEFDPKKYKEVTDLVTENGLDSGVVPYLYYLGDWGTNIVNDWKAEKEKAIKEGTPVPAPPNVEDLKKNVSDLQNLAIDEYYKTLNAINSGDKDIIREQVYLANPNIDAKTAEGTIKLIHENRQRSIAIGKAQTDSQASQVLAQLKNGRRFADIPSVEMDALPEHVKSGLKEYDRRKALNSFTTDSNLYASLAYDNDNLKKMDWAQFYSYAGYLNPEDFANLANRKQKLEQMGDKELNDLTKGLSTQVEYALSRLGVKATGDTQKRIYNTMKRTIVDLVSDKINETPDRKLSDEEILKTINSALEKEITVKGTLWNSYYVVEDLLTSTTGLASKEALDAVVDAGLKASGYPDPNNLDRTELLVRVMINPRRVIPGASVMYDKIPANRRGSIENRLRREGKISQDPRKADRNLVVSEYLQYCVTKNEKKE